MVGSTRAILGMVNAGVLVVACVAGGPICHAAQAGEARGASVEAVCGAMAALMPVVIPKGTRFVTLDIKWQGDEKPPDISLRGWLLASDPDLYVLYTPFGVVEKVARQPKGPGRQACARPITGLWDPPWTYVAEPRLQVIALADEVKHVLELRRTGENGLVHLGHEGSLKLCAPSSEPGKAYQLILGYWLHEHGHIDLANAILLSLLVEQSADALRSTVAQWLGQVYGYAMLGAFVGSRDYDGALGYALAMPEEAPLHGFAEGLRAQIPRRRADFKGRVLPTPEEWKLLSTTMSRPHRIQFLCDRMRLLNCFQLGQPDTVDITLPQYSEPLGMSRNAAWRMSDPEGLRAGHLHTGQGTVINPYVELTGKQSELARRVSPPTAPITLTVADILLIAPYLKEDWYILAVGFARDFMPERYLLSTRRIFCDILDDLVGRKLCDPDALSRMNAAELDRYVQKIVTEYRDRGNTHP
jgi:hypothetical protein